MKKHFRHLVALMIVAVCGLIGWWSVRELGSGPERVSKVIVPEVETQKPEATPRTARPARSAPARHGSTVEIFSSSEPDEVILRFPTDEAYETFLYAVQGSKLGLVSQLDRLRAMRLRYDEWSDLSAFLVGENVTAYDSLPAVPPSTPAVATRQEGLVGFGDSLLPWLGITGDNSRWGAGVKIAVLDTGIVANAGLPGLTRSIAITPFPNDLNKTHGHGTAVASLIAGHDPAAPGIAPAAELISIRVGDESGKADSYALAAGILAAIDSGAQIINISMGTSEDNPLIEEAVAYAHDRDVLIVAATGNSEGADALYPAAYPSVVSVGAVDARGEHLEFSNYGTYLSLTAPGYSINATWPGGRYTRMSGTSASAPIVTGAIAATMSDGTGVKMSASQAAEIVMNHADDAGLPGPDSEYGFGILDVGRIMSRGVPGLIDAAITSQRLVRSQTRGGSDEIQVTIQNRGTTILVNTFLQVSTPFGNRQFNVTTLAPGAIQTFSVPVRLAGVSANTPIQVESTLSLGSSGRDLTPHNNRRSDTLYAR